MSPSLTRLRREERRGKEEIIRGREWENEGLKRTIMLVFIEEIVK